MTRRALVFGLVLGASSIASVPTRAAAEPSRSDEAREHVKASLREGKYGFCSSPRRPLHDRQRALCPLAAEVEECAAFAAACKDAPWSRSDDASSSRARAPSFLSAVAQALVWLFLAAIVVAIALPIVRAILRARRDEKLKDVPVRPNVASPLASPAPPEPEQISDAEAALRAADDHARRGELDRALGLYLAASLAALDRRGAIRLARHRTNGEYVRSCAEEDARLPLREIVREVDKIQFGKKTPTEEGVREVASRATSLVRVRALARSATTLAGMMLLVLLAGCGGLRAPMTRANDPAGDELPMEILRRSGFTVSHLDSAIVSLPIPDGEADAPILVVDVTRVPLEEETAAHLMRWVEAGGVLVLFGDTSEWPAELRVERDHASSRDLVVESELFEATGARVASPAALRWSDAEPVAWLGKSVYAAHKPVGSGVVVGVAGADLFTNVGAARPDNGAALVALLDVAAIDRDQGRIARGVTVPAAAGVRVARLEDGIPPPSNPFSALVQAGLGKGSWHALAAALVLFLAYGIRHARPRPAAPPERRAFAEHVEATGAFYGRARAWGHALASYGRFAEMRLRERVPRGADPVTFLATRAGVPLADATRTWKRAMEATADDPPRGDELATIRDLRAMLVKALETG